MGKAQVSLEYLILTAFILVIVIIIFAFSIFNYESNVKMTKAGNSIESLVKTADLVYARGYGTVLYATVSWPNGIKSIGIVHKCKETAELAGCPGGQDTQCTCTLGSGCLSDTDCIKYSAVQLVMNDDTQLLYGSKTKLCIKTGTQCVLTPAESEFPVNGAEYKVKVFWVNLGGTDYIALQGVLD